MNQCPICGYANQPQARFCQSCGRQLPGSQTISLGGLVQNRYQVINLLGQGGMGAVYLVADSRIGGKQLAMKEMSDAAITDPAEKAETIRAFQQEATLLAQLDHPNIPKVSDFFSENGKHYIVMEYVPGDTLEHIFAQRAGPFSEAEVVEWGRQLTQVLIYLHSRVPPIIFRDFKPGNIMLTPQGAIKLIDFGIARMFKTGKSGDTMIIGTKGFAPPEQYGKGQTDVRSDIYSLGVVLHHLLTRYDPLTSAFNLPPARQINPAVSPVMEAVLARATQMNPDYRFQSAVEMLAALPVKASLPPTVITPSVVGPTVVGPTPPPLPHPAKSSRGVPLVVVALLVIALVVGGALVVTNALGKGSPQAGPPATDTPSRTAQITPADASGPGSTVVNELALPDLIVKHVYLNMRGYQGGCVAEYEPVVVVACVQNQGQGDAAPLAVAVDGQEGARSQVLRAGETQCLETNAGASGGADAQITIQVDPDNVVVESDENNNSWSGAVPLPTPPARCDEGGSQPAPADTPIPTNTAEPPPTDTPTAMPTSDWRITDEPVVRELVTRYGQIKVDAYTYLNDRFGEILVDPVLERQRRGICWLRNMKYYYDYSNRFSEILSVSFADRDRATVITHVMENRVLRHSDTGKTAKDYGAEDYKAIYELARQSDGRWSIYCLQALPDEGPVECKIEIDPNAVNPCTQPQN